MKILLSDIATLKSSPAIDDTGLLILACVTIAFIAALVVTIFSNNRARKAAIQTANVTSIMRHALEIGGVSIVKFNMMHRYVKSTFGDLLPKEGVTYEEFMERIHPEDRPVFDRFITHISQQTGDSNEVSFRWNSQTQGQTTIWRNVYATGLAEGLMLPRNVVCTITDETKEMKEQRQEHELTDRYQSIFRKSIAGISFYDKNGVILAANENMAEIFHFQSEHDPYYFGKSIFRRPPFRDTVDPDNLEELNFCTHITIPERGVNSFMEIMFKPVRNGEGMVQNILLVIREITEERDMYLQAKENDRQTREANEKIQNYEAELLYLMENCDMRVWRADFNTHIVTFHKQLSQIEREMTFEEFADLITDGRTESAKNKFSTPDAFFNKPVTYLLQMRPVFHDRSTKEWNLVNSIPLFDKNGHQTGSFGTIRNMTQLIEAQEKLKEETRRANDSARLKSVFMANMTHEIRTPLNAIVGFSDVLSMIESPEDKKEMVRVIMNNCDMLLRLVNDILEVSGMDANAIKLEPVDVDFSLAFNDICETLKQRVQEPGVEFIKDNPYKTFPTYLDPKRIQQVVTNFVTNAVKYTHEGHIKVGYRQEERTIKNKLVAGGLETKQGIYVYCEDTGAGIPKDKQSSVFERFVKLNDYVQGTGLGLSICKAIANRSGGQIGVTSEGEGHGSTFWMWVPCELKQAL